MRLIRALGALATVAFVATACADQPDADIDDLEIPPAAETSVPPATPPVQPADIMPAQTLAMNSVGGSQVTGDVEIDDQAGQLMVNVHLTNSSDGAVHQGHIHTGTCEAPGAVVQPLGEVTIGADGTGMSENTVTADITTLLDGQHVVAFHEAGGEPGATIVCAAIPAASASATPTM